MEVNSDQDGEAMKGLYPEGFILKRKRMLVGDTLGFSDRFLDRTKKRRSF